MAQLDYTRATPLFQPTDADIDDLPDENQHTKLLAQYLNEQDRTIERLRDDLAHVTNYVDVMRERVKQLEQRATEYDATIASLSMAIRGVLMHHSKAGTVAMVSTKHFADLAWALEQEMTK